MNKKTMCDMHKIESVIYVLILHPPPYSEITVCIFDTMFAAALTINYDFNFITLLTWTTLWNRSEEKEEEEDDDEEEEEEEE